MGPVWLQCCFARYVFYFVLFTELHSDYSNYGFLQGYLHDKNSTTIINGSPVYQPLFNSSVLQPLSLVPRHSRHEVGTSTVDAMVCDVRGLFESVYATLGSSARAIIGSSSPLTPDSLQSLMQALGGVRDQCFVAFGSGPGHAVLAADKLGATFSFGIEMLSNADAIAVNFLKAAKDLSCNSSKLLLVHKNDFCSAGVPFNPTIGISYWDGFALSDRLELLRDIRITSSLDCVALSSVEHPTKEVILGSLNSGSTCVRWEHRGIIDTLDVCSVLHRFDIFKKQPANPDHLPSGGELSYLHPFPSDLCLSIIDFQASESGHGKRIRSDTQGVPMADWLDLGRVFHEYDLSIACSTKKSVLGKGGYGTVVKLYHSASKSYVAAKIQTKSTYQNCSNNPLMRECSILGYC